MKFTLRREPARTLCLELKTPAQTLRDGWIKAKVAATSTSGAVALAGHIEDSDALAPLNAISHIVWGDEAYQERDFSLKYTGTAIALNEVSVAGWAFLHEWIFGRSRENGNSAFAALGAGAIAILAYVVDYHAVPARFKPGFERHLQPKSLVLIYILLALSLVLGDALTPKKKD